MIAEGNKLEEARQRGRRRSPEAAIEEALAAAP
jgi:hypothetical protein